jgi:hypothetical protein
MDFMSKNPIPHPGQRRNLNIIALILLQVLPNQISVPFYEFMMSYQVKKKVPSLHQDVFFPVLLLGHSSCWGVPSNLLGTPVCTAAFSHQGTVVCSHKWFAKGRLNTVNISFTLIYNKARLPQKNFTLVCTV